MFRTSLLLVLLSSQAHATSHWNNIEAFPLPLKLERLIDSKFTPTLGRKDLGNDADLLKEILEASNKPEIVGNPDELKGCVTKSRTTCTGSGKERECTTDSWEVCVSSD